jgi:uncharacterized protein (DUF433 family)
MTAGNGQRSAFVALLGILMRKRLVYTPTIMPHLEFTQTAPLTFGDDGTIRITGSRVTLDSLDHAFQHGATEEQIQDSFPSLTLREIYGAIAYYLEHQEQVDAYLREQTQAAEETQHTIESRQDSTVLRERIRARRMRDTKA